MPLPFQSFYYSLQQRTLAGEKSNKLDSNGELIAFVTLERIVTEVYLYLLRYRTQKFQKSFKHQGAKIWNSVPYEFFKKSPFDQFKLKYKKYLLLNHKSFTIIWN